ncbi:MAG: PEP-CTERM sorting domain-containing protein [Pirellulales bacterium]|nr:PEP-CTERM sorting domain-containing protein [Pirellulales bacterium]
MDDSAFDNIVTDVVSGYNGQLYEATIIGDMPLNTFNRSIPGQFGTALDMQGDVWTDLAAYVANLRPAGDYTLSMWVKNVDNKIVDELKGRPVFSWDISNPYYPRFQFNTGYVWDTPGRVASFYASADSGAGYLGTSAQLTWEADQWHHMALTVENIEGINMLKLYQDGNKVNTVMGMFKVFGTGDTVIDVPTPSMYPEMDRLQIGCADLGSLATRQYANLPLDDVAFWDEALSSAQIRANVFAQGASHWNDVVQLFPGDTNGDNVVDSEDARKLAANWLKYNIGYDETDGDFNGDKWVDDLDASILAANWTSSGEGATVPEPSVLALLLSSALAFLLWRRR